MVLVFSDKIDREKMMLFTFAGDHLACSGHVLRVRCVVLHFDDSHIDIVVVYVLCIISGIGVLLSWDLSHYKYICM